MTVPAKSKNLFRKQYAEKIKWKVEYGWMKLPNMRENTIYLGWSAQYQRKIKTRLRDLHVSDAVDIHYHLDCRMGVIIKAIAAAFIWLQAMCPRWLRLLSVLRRWFCCC